MTLTAQGFEDASRHTLSADLNYVPEKLKATAANTAAKSYRRTSVQDAEGSIG
jgi:hypothetical protein